MNFDFDDTQYALRDLARELFARESPPSRVRELWDGKPFDRSVWKTMAEAGLCGITVPSAFGGAGGNEIDLALLFEEVGRAALPEPLVETVGFAAPAIVELGSPEMKEQWLPRIASGDAMIAVEGPLDGYVAWAAEADLLLCVRDDGVHAVARDDFRTTPAPTIDPARPLYSIDCNFGYATQLGDEANRFPRPGRTIFGTACVQNGVAMRLLEMTLDHVKNRVQFGRPVGSFQTVKHKLADMHVALAGARPTAWYAAYALATQADDAHEAAMIAKVAASDAEALCNREALQCHGGIGFTWEHDLHLWMKRGIVLRSMFGTAALHRRLLARRVLAT